MIGICSLFAVAAISFTNEWVSLDINGRGMVESLRERIGDRELVRNLRPFVSVRGEKCLGFSVDGDILRWRFGVGDVGLEVIPFCGGWTFRIASCSLPPDAGIVVGDLAPVCTNYLGTYANMLSDEFSGVCLRAYDIPLGMHVDGKSMRLFCARAKGPHMGLRFGLSAGPRSDLQQMLRGMTHAAGVPINTRGGAWSLGNEENRRSYLQPCLRHSAVDRWIAYAERGGFGTIHLRRWMKAPGHYEPNREFFPRGMEDVYDAARRIRAAGLFAGIHTLTGCISPEDSWVAGPHNRDLLSWCSYSLATPMSAGATELEVTEPPKFVHDTILSYFGNGNAFRIGNEIVQYCGFTKTPPYRYTGLVRGAFGTKAAAHPAGEPVDYLQQRYNAFYPRPESPLGDELANEIAGFVNGGEFEQVYMDGSEGMGLGVPEYTAEMRRKVFGAIGREISVEASCSGAHNWWYQSRDGAWDGANFDFKRFFDLHVESMGSCRMANLLEPQLGWWHFLGQWLQHRGQFTDDVEYFAAHVAGADASMSFERLDLNDGVPTLYRENAFTVLGWYERFRMARAFRPDVLADFRVPGKEFRLRQDGDGVWKVAPVTVMETACRVSFGERHEWSGSLETECPVELRVEPLYSNRPHSDPGSLDIFSGNSKGVVLTSAMGVTASMEDIHSEHGPALAIHAKRPAAVPRKCGWVKCARTYAKHLEPGSRRGIGLWVRGDGSGSVLDVQLRVPREIGEQIADHMFTIDFTGWKYLETSIRERTPALAREYVWDDSDTGYRRFLSELNMLHVGEVNILLNNLPADGDVGIALSDVRMMGTFDAVFEDAEVTLGGIREQVPFAVVSGEYATRESDGWRHWDIEGNLKAFSSARPITLPAGGTMLSFSVTPPKDGTARARICAFAIGNGREALDVPLGANRSKFLRYEAELSGMYSPSFGLYSLLPVKVRPGEGAQVEFQFVGPLVGGVLEFDGGMYPVRDLSDNEEFTLRIPGTHSGVMPVKLTAAKANCRVGHVKRYR